MNGNILYILYTIVDKYALGRHVNKGKMRVINFFEKVILGSYRGAKVV